MTVFVREEARVSLEARIAKELCSAALVIPMCCTVTTRRRLWVTACVSKRVGTLPSASASGLGCPHAFRAHTQFPSRVFHQRLRLEK